MANPFYVEPPRSPLGDVVQSGLGIIHARQTGDQINLMKEDSALKARGLAQEKEKNAKLYGGSFLDTGTNQMINVPQAEGLEQRRVNIATPPHKANFNERQFGQIKTVLERGWGPGVGKALFLDLQDYVDNPSDQNGSNGDVYRWLTNPTNLDAYRESLVQDAQDALDKEAYKSPGQRAKLEKVVSTFSDPQSATVLRGIIDSAFVPTMQSLAMENAKDKGVIVPEGAKYVNPSTGATIAEGKPKEAFSGDAKLIFTMQNDPDPAKRAQAKAIYEQEMSGKINIAKASGEARAAAFGDIRMVNVIDPNTGMARPMAVNEYNERAAKGEVLPLAQYDVDIKEQLAAAAQRSGTRAASVRTASEVYDQEAPELLRLRQKAQAKGLLPTGGLKDIEAVNQWLGKKVSDPETVVLQKKTKMLADTLQRTIGGSQGGEWAFRVAADILDPTYDQATFKAVLESHGNTLRSMATAYKEFGKKGKTETPKQVGRFKIEAE